jgi:hypothetical protein
MEVNMNYQIEPMKPAKPAEPVSPPGGNIENRQPPSEPVRQDTATTVKSNSSSLISVYV